MKLEFDFSNVKLLKVVCFSNIFLKKNSCISDVYQLCKDGKKAEETRQVHDSYAQRLEKDRLRATEMQEHRLVEVIVK